MINNDSYIQLNLSNFVDPKMNLMKKNLKDKYCINTNSYDKLFINQLLNPKTTLHAQYKEKLLLIDSTDFLKHYYNISECFRKINFLSKLNSLLIKPFPNFLRMNLFYFLMQKNLQNKQNLLNSYFKNITNIKEEISHENKCQFQNFYSESFSKVFEMKEYLFNNYKNKRFNTHIQDESLEKEKSIMLIENLIQTMQQSNKGSSKKPPILNNEYKKNVVKLQLKSHFQLKRNNNLNNKKESLEEKYISNNVQFKNYLNTRNKKQKINLCKKVNLEIIKKHSKFLVSQDSSLKYSTVNQTLTESENSKSKEFNFYNSNKLYLNIKNRLISEGKIETQRFVTTKTFFERSKLKKHKQQNKINSFIFSIISHKPPLSSSKTRNSKVSLVTHSKTSNIERSSYKKIPFQTNKTITRDNLLYQTECHVKTTQSDKTRENYSKKISEHRNRSKQAYPTKLMLKNVQHTDRNLRSSIFKDNKCQHSNHYYIKNKKFSNNNSNNYLTSSILSDSTEFNQCTTIKPRSSNYYLYDNKVYLKKFALFLRKDIS